MKQHVHYNNKHNFLKCDHCQARIKKEGLKNEKELQSYLIKRMEMADGPNSFTDGVRGNYAVGKFMPHYVKFEIFAD